MHVYRKGVELSQNYIAVLKSEVQHLDSYKVLPWKNNINSFSLKSG
jgi:hypothetical protein